MKKFLPLLILMGILAIGLVNAVPYGVDNVLYDSCSADNVAANYENGLVSPFVFNTDHYESGNTGAVGTYHYLLRRPASNIGDTYKGMNISLRRITSLDGHYGYPNIILGESIASCLEGMCPYDGYSLMYNGLSWSAFRYVSGLGANVGVYAGSVIPDDGNYHNIIFVDEGGIFRIIIDGTELFNETSYYTINNNTQYALHAELSSTLIPTNEYTQLLIKDAYDIVSVNNWTAIPINVSPNTGVDIYRSTYDSTNDLIYTGQYAPYIVPMQLGVYNKSSNTWSSISDTDAGNWAGYANVISIIYNPTNNLVYTGQTGGLLGAYNISDNTWYDLSATDTLDWAGLSNILSLTYDSDSNLIYTGLTDAKFGVYDPSTNVWTDLSATSGLPPLSNVNALTYNNNSKLIYLGIDTGILGWYNASSNSGGNSGYDLSAIKSLTYDATSDLVYVGQTGGKLRTYKYIDSFPFYVWTDLSATDPGDWASTSDTLSLTIDSQNNLIYTGSNSLDHGFGVYDPSTNVWTDLGLVSTPQTIYTLTYDSKDGTIYTGLSYNGLGESRFGVYDSGLPPPATTWDFSFLGETGYNIENNDFNTPYDFYFDTIADKFTQASFGYFHSYNTSECRAYTSGDNNVDYKIYNSFCYHDPDTNLETRFVIDNYIPATVVNITRGISSPQLACNDSLIFPCAINSVYDYSVGNIITNFTTITGIINSGDIQSGTDWIYVNSSSVANVPATITFNNVTNSTYVPYRDGLVCGAECSNITNDGNTLTFDVSGFSNYSYGNATYPTYPTWQYLNFTITSPSDLLNTMSTGSVATTDGNSIFISLANTTNSLYPGMGVYNISTGVLSLTNGKTSNSVLGYSPYDGNIYLAYRNGTTSTYFGAYNISGDYMIDLSAADPSNWAGTNINMQAVATYNNLVFTGLSGANNFGVYNISDGVWYNLGATDPGNWASTYQIRSLAVDPINGLVYTGLNSLRFGVYNISSGIWSQLPNGEGVMYDLAYDSSRDVVYVSDTGIFKIYNPANNSLDTIFVMWSGGTSGSLYYDSINDLVYFTSFYLGNIMYGVYNPVNGSVTDLSETDINDWVTGANSPRKLLPINNSIYTIMNNPATLGVYYDSPTCVESWVHNDTECTGTYITQYYDRNSCGTTINLPVDNGTISSCNALWKDLSNTVVGDFFGTNGIRSVFFDNVTGLIYLPSGYNLAGVYTPLLGVYNSTSNTTINLNLIYNGASTIVNKDYTNNILYIGSIGSSYFGTYDLNTDTFTELSATDTITYPNKSTPNWMGANTNVVDIAILESAGLVFTSAGSQKFGMYNISDGVWYNLNETDAGDWAGNVGMYGLCYDGTDKVYTMMGGRFGVFNITDMVWYNLNNTNVSSWLSATTMGVCAYDATHNLLYVGTGVGASVLGVYDPINGTITDLSTTDTNNWVGTSRFGAPGVGLNYDPVNDLVYTSLNNGKFGVYNPSTNVWEDLSSTDTNNWANEWLINDNAIDTINNKVYTAHNMGLFGVFNFISNVSVCSICNETCSPCGGGCTATNLSYMYYNVTNFDATYGNISGWDTSCIVDMRYMFGYSDFNQPIGNWDISSVVSLNDMFQYATNFNQDISGWNTSSVILMQYVFRGSPFNQPIGSWDTSKVTKMDGLFRDTPFNQNISGWNTSSVIQMINMFNNATSYNQPMNDWDMSKVTNIANMFQGATSFNQPLNNWNTGKVTNMLSMFYNTATFDQDLSSWNVANVTTMNSMFNGSNLSTTNYDLLLNSWSTQTVKNNVLFGVGATQYTIAASSARNILTSTYNWTITDGGLLVTAMLPNVTKFDGSTSNFTGLTLEQLQNYSGLILENTSNGRIDWNGITNVNGADFDTYVNITPNLISVDSANLDSTINSSTNISFYNLAIVSPWIYKDGVRCTNVSGCNILSNNGSTIVFTAPSFSNYTLGNCSEVWVQQPPMTCTGTNPSYTILYADTNTCGTTYTLPANNGTIVTCVLISYGDGTTTGYKGSGSTYGYVNVSTNANYTIIKIYNETGDLIEDNLETVASNNGTRTDSGLFDALHPATYGYDNNYSTYAQPNATGYATIYTNYTIPYMATRLSQWNLVTYSNDGPGIDVNVTIPDDCWLYPTLQLSIEMYNDVGIHYVYPQCYNGTAWNILTIDQNSNHSGLYEESMYWILANGTDYTTTNLTEGVYFYNATGYPETGQPVSTTTQNFTIIPNFHSERYTVTFPYPDGYKLNSASFAVPFTSNDTYYNHTIYHIQGITNTSYNFNYTTTAKTYTFTGLPNGDYYYAMTIYDKAGNNQYYDPNITIDTTLPVITYLANTQADNSYIGFNKTNATVNISVTDDYLNTTTIWLYKFGSVVDSYSLYNTTLMDKTFTGLTNGVYKFNVTATDEANNTGTAATRTFTIIDSFQSGLYTVTYNYPNDYVSNVSTNNLINFTTTDPNYAYAIYNMSGAITNTTVKGFTPTSTEGVYTYSVRIYDLAGNSYQYPTQNITIDGTSPVVNFIGITPANNAYIGNNRTNITVNIQVTDMHLNASTNTIYLYDNSGNLLDQANGTNLTTFTGLTAGVYKFNATSQDTYGNLGISATRTITLVPFFNASAYDVQFVYNSTDIIGDATFLAEAFTTTDPYYSYVTYGIQLYPSGFNGIESTSRQFKNWTVPVDGLYHNYLTIYDLAGNSQYYDQNITVAAGIPTLSYAADTDAHNSYKNQPHIYVHILPNATNTTNLTTIIYLYNSSMAVIATANNTNTSNFTGLTDGEYYFNAVASNLGYNTTALTRKVTIHTSFSSGLYNVTFPTTNYLLTNNATFNATVFNTTDPYYAYAVYSISGNTYPSGTYSDSTNTTTKYKSWTSPDSSGYLQYGVTIYDLAGNSRYYGPRYIDIDTQPPQLSYWLGDPDGSYVGLRESPPGYWYAYVWVQVQFYDAHPAINSGPAYPGNQLRLYGPNGFLGPIGLEYYIPNGTYWATADFGTIYDPVGIGNLTTGYYYYVAEGRDILGNGITLPARIVTVIREFNTSAYTLTFPNANNSYKNVNYFTAANFTTVDPYYNRTMYSLQGLTNTSYVNNVTTTNTTYTYTGLPDGRYYYAVTIYDHAGNFHYYDPNITIDTTSPTINFTNSSDGSYVYMRPYLYLQTEVIDTNVGNTTISVYNSTGGLIGSNTSNTSITTFTTGNLTDAFYYINATTVDLAGNNASTTTYQIELDYIKDAAQFRAAEKVTDNHLYYNITFNSSMSNFQQSSPGMSKSTTVNNIPWNIYNITIRETVNGSYYTCNYYNWNATNSYSFTNCALYNSLDYINITHSYLGTDISNYNVTIINTANVFIEINTNVSNYSIGLVKGLSYNIYFDHPAYFSKNITYNPINTTETIIQQLNQTNITLRFKSAFAGNILNGTNITINDTTVNGKVFQTNTGYIYFNPNSGVKNFTMQAAGDIIPQPFTLTFTDRETSIRDVLLYPILNVSIFDEKASLLNETFFNFTHTTEAKYTLYCYYPQNYTISGTIPNSTFGPINIPTPCIFNRIRFDLVFTNIDATEFSYYRTITFPPDTTQFTFPVYLADHTTTDTVETSLKPYDIFGIYTVDQNTQIQIKEIFPSGTKLITSDYMDSEGKITATLMTAGQYIITVLADDAPIRTLGPYYADTAGTKILRLFDVTLTGPTDEQTAILAETSILENDSIRMYYADATATTQLLTLQMYESPCEDVTPLMTPIIDETYTQSMLAISGNVVLITYNVNGSRFMNRTSNRVYCTTYNRTDTANRNQYTSVDAVYDSKKKLPAKFDSEWTLPWIIIIVLTMFALGASARTAPVISLLISLFAFLLYGWEWYTGAPGVLSHAALGLTIVLAFFYNFKRVA